MRRPAFLLLLLVLGVVPPAPGRADAIGPCPESFVQMTRTATAPSATSAVVYDSTYVNVYSARVSFDRNLGRTFLSGNSGGRLTASSRVVERFDVVGLPPGTPVDATLEFRLEGWSENTCGGSGCGVELQATLTMGLSSAAANADQAGPGNSRRDLATTLSLPIHLVAGSPVEAQFLLRYATGPGGSAEGEVTGWYGVSGLPPGVAAIACPGANVTPVQRASWGSLKLRYR